MIIIRQTVSRSKKNHTVKKINKPKENTSAQLSSSTSRPKIQDLSGNIINDLFDYGEKNDEQTLIESKDQNVSFMDASMRSETEERGMNAGKYSEAGRTSEKVGVLNVRVTHEERQQTEESLMITSEKGKSLKILRVLIFFFLYLYIFRRSQNC